MYYALKREVDCLNKKVEFVNAISQVFETSDTGTPVTKVEYKYFAQPMRTPDGTIDQQVYFEEYLVVTYRGGAINVRNCNWNSNTAIFIELAKILNGGYYDEVRDYQEIGMNAVIYEIKEEE